MGRTHSRQLWLWGLALLSGVGLAVCSPAQPTAQLDAAVGHEDLPPDWDPLCYARAEMGCSPPCQFCADGNIQHCTSMENREETVCEGDELCALTAVEFVYREFVCVAPATCEPRSGTCLDAVTYSQCLEYLSDTGVATGEVVGACEDGMVCVPDATQVYCAYLGR